MTTIIKCTLKKFVSIIVKLLKYGTIIGIILAATAGIGYTLWSIMDIIVYAPWEPPLLTKISTLLARVSWYVWIIIAIPSIIMGYSYLSCWLRQNPNKIRNFWYELKGSGIDVLITCIIIGVSLQIGYWWLNNIDSPFVNTESCLLPPFFLQLWPLLIGLFVGFIGMICSKYDNR